MGVGLSGSFASLSGVTIADKADLAALWALQGPATYQVYSVNPLRGYVEVNLGFDLDHAGFTIVSGTVPNYLSNSTDSPTQPPVVYGEVPANTTATHVFVIAVTDTAGRSASRRYTFTITPSGLLISFQNL